MKTLLVLVVHVLALVAKFPGPGGTPAVIAENLLLKHQFEYHRWQANLRVLGVQEIKTVPYVPLSHPFIERLIGTARREFLDHVLLWNSVDLQRKLEIFRIYYNKTEFMPHWMETRPRKSAENPL